MIDNYTSFWEKKIQFISESEHMEFFKKQAFWREDKSVDPLQNREDCWHHLEVASAIHHKRHKPT